MRLYEPGRLKRKNRQVWNSFGPSPSTYHPLIFVSHSSRSPWEDTLRRRRHSFDSSNTYNRRILISHQIRGNRILAGREVRGDKGYLRWLGLIAFLLASPASDTACLGTALCDLDLPTRHGQRMFARTTPFPWNMNGSARWLLRSQRGVGG